MTQNGFLPGAFFIGYTADPVELGNLRESLTKAQIAGLVCKFQNLETLSYKYVGIYKYIISLVHDEILCNEIKEKIAILEDYDAKHEANLTLML